MKNIETMYKKITVLMLKHYAYGQNGMRENVA